MLLAALFLTMSIASVTAGGYGPQFPIVHHGPPTVLTVTGAPALSSNKVTGLLSFTYPNGQRVTLTSTSVTLRLCGTGGCTTVLATLTSTGPGTYSYSFTLPSTVTGSVSIVLPAGSLTDSYGTPFPSSDMVIGTFSTGTSSVAAMPGSPMNPVSPSVMQTADPIEQTTQPQINLLVPALLAVLAIVGVALAALPKRTF